MCIDPIVLFFIGGVVISTLWPKIQIPQWAYQFISAYLLITIGLKGGISLRTWCCWSLIIQAGIVIVLALTCTVIATAILKKTVGYSYDQAVVIGAHYGSVSLGTFAVAMNMLKMKGIGFEPYVSLFVALMEFPAIMLAFILLHGSKKQSMWDQVLKLFFQRSLVFLGTSIVIGALMGPYLITPITFIFFDTMRPMLAIFLLEMGFLVGQQRYTIGKQLTTVMLSGLAITLICAFIGLVFGYFMRLSLGGIILVMVLASSASYIAVPASLKETYPAQVALAISYALGVTFAFNVLIGIDLYTYLVYRLGF